MTIRTLALSFAFVLSAAVVASSPSDAVAADWTPAKWEANDTLQFRSDCPGEEDYWSYVWLVVLDGDVYVRLGGRAAGRVDCNKTKMVTAIKIGGEEFPAVEMVPTPEMADRVSAAMAAKYSTDLFVRYMNHPYTMKLVVKGQ